MHQEAKDEIAGILKNLSLYQNRFYSKGYRVPQIYLEQIEACRQRSSMERPISVYFNEKEYETFWLSAKDCITTTWTPTERKTLELIHRGNYIESLERMVCEHAFSEDEKLGLVFKHDFDPNWVKYQLWRVRPSILPEVDFRQHLRDMANRQLVESKNIFPRIVKYITTENRIEIGALLSLIQDMAKTYGFRVVTLSDGAKPRIVVEKELSDKCSLYLEWEDIHSFRKLGAVNLNFVFREPGGKVWRRNELLPFYRANFNRLIPGTWYYSAAADDANLLTLNVIAHMDFMECVSID